MADPLGMRPALARCRLGLGELHARAGYRDAAREHFAVALALFREMGLTSMQERVERQLGEPA